MIMMLAFIHNVCVCVFVVRECLFQPVGFIECFSIFSVHISEHLFVRVSLLARVV